MKVCFIVGTLARGGAEKQLSFMLRALKRSGIDAEVLCLTKGEPYEEDLADAGFLVRWVGRSKNKICRMRDIAGAVSRSRADIIQSSHFYTNIYAGAVGKVLRISSIGAVRSDLTYELDGHRFTGKWQLELPDLLITNSHSARLRLIERRIEPGKIEFLRNVVEVAENAKNSDVPEAGVKVLFVGRLDANKRPERFVRLASILAERFPEVPPEFQIAGDGELRSSLERQGAELGLVPKTLKFLGPCERMGEVYRQADILISTSDREGTPNVVLEAMAHGLPVIATAVGGTKEVLDPTRGILVEPGDEGALVAAATELIANPGLRARFGIAGRRYVHENHSFERLQNGLCEIYQKLLSAAR